MSSNLGNAILISVLVIFIFLEIPVELYPYGVEPVYAKNGMVVSTNETANRVGMEVLKKGGNAVDAAVAVGFVLAVVHPQAGNIGGGGFMMIRDLASGKIYALDFRETAPSGARHDMYIKSNGEADSEASRIGYLAVGVPGTVKGLDEAHRKFGFLKWKDLLEPAARLGEEGYSLSHQQAQSLNSYKNDFKRFASSKTFICSHGRDWQINDVLFQKDLAATIRQIAEKGADDFYNGEIAERLAKAVQDGGGIITLSDLDSYKAIWREPLVGNYHGNTIYGMPLPSSGTAVLIETLNILKNIPLKKYGFISTDYIHFVSEALRRSFMDRAVYMGDSDFVDVPLSELISEEYANKLALTIMPDKASDSISLRNGMKTKPESDNTTHYAVADKWGNVVCVTYTLNSSYGSKAVAGDTGVLLNNEMDDFCVKPEYPNQFGLIESKANAIGPGKRMLSSMTPIIVIKDGEYCLTIGSPGGPTIISAVLQTFLNIVDFDMNIQEAVNAPRFHHQWLPDEIMIERYEFAPDVKIQLERRGHKLAEKKYIGDTQVIMHIFKSGIFLGASDPRMEGRPVGY